MTYNFSRLTDLKLMEQYDRINGLIGTCSSTEEYAKLINQSHIVMAEARKRRLLK